MIYMHLVIQSDETHPAPKGGGSLATLIAYPDFLVATRAAQYADYAGHHGVQVANAEEFAAMQAYILRHYADVEVTGSLLVGNQIFDCVTTQSEYHVPSSSLEAGCPQGTIPKRRITLEELTRFRTVSDFLGKAPGEKSAPDFG